MDELCQNILIRSCCSLTSLFSIHNNPVDKEGLGTEIVGVLHIGDLCPRQGAKRHFLYSIGSRKKSVEHLSKAMLDIVALC